MLIYAEVITPRLKYITAFAGRELFGMPFGLTANADEYRTAGGVKINYSNDETLDGLQIRPHGLLNQHGIVEQQIDFSMHANLPSFFLTGAEFPFDFFAASFYLLSRYEEYLPHEKDMYGRYAHENSLAFRQGFLKRPLVNEWLHLLRRSLSERFNGVVFQKSKYTFIPTYDIDIAWSYREKSLTKKVGGFLKDLVTANWHGIAKRYQVILGKGVDPFDAYEWMDTLHERYKLSPIYFFLLGSGRGKYDKNIAPANKKLQHLIVAHAKKYPVGIHPSWESGDDYEMLHEEISTLSKIIGKPVIASRQHYIRLTLPETYRRLIKHGIKNDYSMGYGSINGFRASVASSFKWYDLVNEQETDLDVLPFCYMEANSFYEQKDNAEQAFEEMLHFYKVISAVGGTYSMIWHNSFLGTDPLAKGWREKYEKLIGDMNG